MRISVNIQLFLYKIHNIEKSLKNLSKQEDQSNWKGHYADFIWEGYVLWSLSIVNLHILLKNWIWIVLVIYTIWVINRERKDNLHRKNSSIKLHCLYWKMLNMWCFMTSSSVRGIKKVNFMFMILTPYHKIGELG